MPLADKVRNGIEHRRQELPSFLSESVPQEKRNSTPDHDWLPVDAAAEFAENTVLAGCIVDPAYLGDAMLRITADDFVRDWRKEVWHALMSLRREGKPVDRPHIYRRVSRQAYHWLQAAVIECRNWYARDYVAIVQQFADGRRLAQEALKDD